MNADMPATNRSRPSVPAMLRDAAAASFVAALLAFPLLGFKLDATAQGLRLDMRLAWVPIAAGIVFAGRLLLTLGGQYVAPIVARRIAPDMEAIRRRLPSRSSYMVGIAMVAVAWSSDRTGERRWHAIGSSLVAALGCVLIAFAGHSAVLSVLALAMIAAGGLGWLAVFWTLPTAFLSGIAAAAGIGWINAISQLGGFVGPDMLGRLRGANEGDNTLAFLILAGVALVVTVLTYALSRRPPQPRPNPAA